MTLQLEKMSIELADERRRRVQLESVVADCVLQPQHLDAVAHAIVEATDERAAEVEPLLPRGTLDSVLTEQSSVLVLARRVWALDSTAIGNALAKVPIIAAQLGVAMACSRASELLGRKIRRAFLCLAQLVRGRRPKFSSDQTVASVYATPISQKTFPWVRVLEGHACVCFTRRRGIFCARGWGVGSIVIRHKPRRALGHRRRRRRACSRGRWCAS